MKYNESKLGLSITPKLEGNKLTITPNKEYYEANGIDMTPETLKRDYEEYKGMIQRQVDKGVYEWQETINKETLNELLDKREVVLCDDSATIELTATLTLDKECEGNLAKLLFGDISNYPDGGIPSDFGKYFKPVLESGEEVFKSILDTEYKESFDETNTITIPAFRDEFKHDMYDIGSEARKDILSQPFNGVSFEWTLNDEEDKDEI